VTKELRILKSVARTIVVVCRCLKMIFEGDDGIEGLKINCGWRRR
jgi:hypothetical protein